MRVKSEKRKVNRERANIQILNIYLCNDFAWHWI